VSVLALEGIAKRFGAAAVLDGISFEVASGEVVALLGPSGSGKTTLLRVVAGFERPDAGAVRFAGERVDRLPPERRGFGMVFQHYALFPHLSVGENVAFGLEGRGLAKPEVARRVGEALARVDLAGFERRRVGEISGGQQQRVAVARALAPEPRVLLLDEPLSNLDPSLRERTRRELARTLSAVGITTLLVTHEQEEAFDLGQRVALLHRGRLEQLATPQELYRRPATRFAAEFVGRAAFLEVAREDGGGPLRIRTPFAETPLAAEAAGGGAAGAGAAWLLLRPEQLALADPGAPGAAPGRVRARRFTGAATLVGVEIPGGEIEVACDGEAPEEGAAVGVRLRAGTPLRVFFGGEPEGAS
jgi:ABC-type Fe3+/spermidine/putrescine transport system ATPase subunit